MAEKRKRSQNFSPEEKQKLVNLLRDHRDTILNKKTDGPANEAKALAWASLTIKFNMSNNYQRSKDSLMKLWDKMKTEAKLNKNYCSNTSKYDILEQACDLIGRGHTSVLAANDSQATTDRIQVKPKVEHINPFIVTYEYDQPSIDDSGEIATDCEDTAKKTKIGEENGDNTCSDVNVKRLDAEDLKLQLLQEEIIFKQEFRKHLLEEMGLKKDLLKKQIDAAACELEIRKEALSQLKGPGGSFTLKKLLE